MVCFGRSPVVIFVNVFCGKMYRWCDPVAFVADDLSIIPVMWEHPERGCGLVCSWEA